MVLTLQKEVEDGSLIGDCFELGTNDLKGLIQLLKDLSLLFSFASNREDSFNVFIFNFLKYHSSISIIYEPL